MPDDVKYFDLWQPNIFVPSKDSTYWFTLLKLAEFNKTQHTIRIEPIIQEGNEVIVHYYGCIHSQIASKCGGLKLNSLYLYTMSFIIAILLIGMNQTMFIK